MGNKFKDLSIIAFATLALTFTIWLPHLLSLPNFWGLSFKEGFSTIYRNYDGLEYIAIAKSFYNPDILNSSPTGLPAAYFASHFPGYSILIALFAPLVGYLKSMLFVSVLSTILAVWIFYSLVRDFKLSLHPLLLSLLCLILPARWLIVHNVGSSEPTFVFFIISAVYFFMKFEQSKKWSHILLAALAGSAAQLVRPPGILVFIALLFYILWHYHKILFNCLKYFPLLLIPVTLWGIFYLYGQTLGDFFAYFHSGDNIHLTFPPFQVFNKDQFWVGEAWLEDIVYIFILGFLGGVFLWKQKLYPMAFLVFTYFAASTLIAHRDISRYILPVTPFVLIAFEKVLTSKEFKIILPIIILAIYLYVQNFILQNVAPIPNLAPFN